MRVIFNSCELDTEALELRREGRVVDLEPKAFSVLVHLLTHRHRAVSKESLLEALWPGEFVTEFVLTRSVRLIRQAVGDDGNRQQVIKTMRGYGYRFVASVSIPPESSTLAHDMVKPLSPPWEEVSPAANSEAHDAPSPAPVDVEEQSIGSTERRSLAVVSCEVLDVPRLANQLDPEDLHDFIQTFHTMCAEVIQRFEGQIAQYRDDGLLVYFGYPQAYDDTAQRAVHASLGILDAMGKLNERYTPLMGDQFAVRLGIHTGVVVVGTTDREGRKALLALGETPTLAAHLVRVAEPDTVVISAATFQLIEGYFTCKELGSYTLEGAATPIDVYQVMEKSAISTRLDVAAAWGLTKFVGREAEIRLLRERWAEVQQGAGRVVVISGEAGIGKSRLVQVIKDEVVEAGHLQLECRGSPYYQHTAFHAVIDWLQRVLIVTRQDTADEKIRKLEHFLFQCGLNLQESLPIFASLLSVPIPAERYSPLPLTSQRQRQQTLEAILALLLKLSEQQPVVLIVEDVQWLDPSTLELMGLLVDQGPIVPILTLVTCRPIFHQPWGARSHLTHLTLSALADDQVQQMLRELTSGKSLPTTLLQQIVAKTDGVPLFVEEMTRLVLESNLLNEGSARAGLAGPLPSLDVPMTLQDSLMARLDQLGSAKRVAQLGATLGRQFSHELLLAISPLEASTIQQELRQLMEADLLYQRGVGSQATYMFKHALIQDVAYSSLLRSTRQQYHQRIAQILEARFADVVETQPEVLAHHCTEAGLSQHAMEYWQRAGQREAKSSAHVEAIAHFRQGLELVRALPDTPKRAQHELVLLMALGASLIMTKGHADLEVERTYARARLLCQLTGDSPQRSRVLFALWGFYLTRAQLDTAWGLGQQLQELAQRTDNPTSMTVAHHTLAITALFRGAFILAREHLEQAFRSEGFQTLRQNVSTTAIVAKTANYSYAAWTLWMLGYPDAARLQSETALRLSEDLSHPFSRTYALIFECFLYQFCRDGARVREQAERAIALASEHRFELWVGLGLALRGWAQAVYEHSDGAIGQMRHSQDVLKGLGVEVTRGYVLVLFAEACAQQGELAAGLTALAEAQNWIGKLGGRFVEAELYRMKGELLLAQSSAHDAEAESCFHQSIHIARGQQAKSWELRATMSLSRLWQSQGKHVDAYNVLSTVYNWFTEGFNTVDLQEAKELLEALSDSQSTG